ncbi:MAG: hypothetical protein GY925_12810 [Actinomycetia bacterium]|nr:hypothetical protein [Actinomycetes bacterium]
MTTDVEIRITDKNATGPGMAAAQRRLDGVKADLKELNRLGKVDGDVDMDTSQVKQAEAEIRDLDSIPPPMIEPQADVQGLEDQLAGVDLSDMGGSMASQITGLLGAAGPVGGAVGAAAGGLAAVFGDDFIEGVTSVIGGRQVKVQRALRTGLSSNEIADIGEDAAELYMAGWGEGLGDLSETLSTIKGELAELPTFIDDKEMSRRFIAVAETYRIEVDALVLASRKLVNEGLAGSVEEALDVITGSLTEAGVQGDEALDILREFSPFFAKLGLEGPTAVGLVTSALRDDLFPVADRAGEVVEEFVNRVSNTRDAEEGLNAIGFSIDKMNQSIEAGRGEEVLGAVVNRLADMADQTEANVRMVEIFGASVEGVTALELADWYNEAAGASATYAGQAELVANANERAASNFEIVQRRATGLGRTYGGVLNVELGGLIAAHDGFNSAIEKAIPFIGDEEVAVDRLSNVSADASRAMFEMAMETNTATDAAIDLAGEVRSLDDVLAEFAGRYDSDRIFRAVDDDIRRLVGAVTDLEGDIFDVGAGFDTTTEAGSRMERLMEDLAGNVDTLGQELSEGSITGAQFEGQMAKIEDALRAAAAQMNLTEAETQELIDKYLQVPAEVTTKANLDDHQALSDIGALNRSLDGIPSSKSTRHDFVTHYRTVGTAPRSGPRRHGGITGSAFPAATGGIRADESLTLVGEEGPELVNLGVGASVATTGDSSRRLNAAGSGGGITVNMVIQGSLVAERDIVEIVRDEFQNGSLG